MVILSLALAATLYAQTSTADNDISDVVLFELKIDPETPPRELLPLPPSDPPAAVPYLGDDLAVVPEIALEHPMPRDWNFATCVRHNAHSVAKIKYLNDLEQDGFIHLLNVHRPDLQGLPFLWGEAARSSPERSRAFKQAVSVFRLAMHLQQSVHGNIGNEQDAKVQAVRSFWKSVQYVYETPGPVPGRTQFDDVSPDAALSAGVAALMHLLATESAGLHLELTHLLAGTSHPETTRALARLALFSPDEKARQSASHYLRGRDPKDYAGILVDGLRYPWPNVARRAADAITQIGLRHVCQQLAQLLDERDPLEPERVDTCDGPLFIVRQLVRLNHHRNCLLCHAPVGQRSLPDDVEIAPLPVRGKPLPVARTNGYPRPIVPQAAVRLDVTYLREDFAAMVPVEDAAPWPREQRFDFLVRRVALSPREKEQYDARWKAEKEREPFSHRDTVLTLLRTLTGVNAGATAAEWRRALELPEYTGRVAF